MSKPMISVAGIRGIVGDSLVPEEFLRYVLAFGTILDGGPVVIGGDSRLSREMMRHLAFAGLASTGSPIIDIGLVPTPTVGLMVRKLGARGGIAITASHNPPEWNAYKFFDHEGSFLSKQQNSVLLDLAASGGFRRADFLSLGKVTRREDAIELHLKGLLAAIDTSPVTQKQFRVVIDCCNGVGGLIMQPLMRLLGCQADLFDTDIDAVFPRNPEPLPENLGNLARRVKECGADIGFAVDPDVDRLAIVDNLGRPIGEERTLTLCAAQVLRTTKGPLVANLSTTRALDDVARAHGVPLYRTPIGEANVVGKIRECGAAIGGEGNGGVIYPPVHPGRDAATGVALILTAMASRGASIAELNSEIPDYVMLKTKFDIAGLRIDEIGSRMKSEFVDALEMVTDDGVKAVYDHSWVHLRPSGTEPVVRVFAEAPTDEEARALINRVQTRVVAP
jgi:phosphomannomutase